MMATQNHTKLVVAKAIHFLHPHQVPVIVSDRLLYGLQENCRMVFPEGLGKQKMVSFMGHFHVEMIAQEYGEKLLTGSVWDRMFCLTTIYETGVTVSLLGGKHVRRTQYACHPTLARLPLLEIEA